MKALESSDIFGNWGTLLLPIDDKDQIDFLKLENEIDALISLKVNGIYSNGTAGEFYNQTEEEFDRISSLLAEKCNTAGMPFQIGCSHMSPVLCLERIKRSVKHAPGAIQVILPDWAPPVMSETVEFLKRVMETADGIGIVLYNPPHAKVRFKPEDFAMLRDAGVHLTGCKTAGGDAQWYTNMRKYTGDLSVFIPGHHLATGIQQGAHGAYSNIACLHPAQAQRWYDMTQQDMPAAMEWQSRIQKFISECIIPYITAQGYSNQAVDKFMAALGGWTDISPRLRWPYKGIDEFELPAVRLRAREILPEFFD